MTKLRFNDGVEIETDGELRIHRESDGLYVVGGGMMCAVDSRDEGERMIADIQKRRSERNEKT